MHKHSISAQSLSGDTMCAVCICCTEGVGMISPLKGFSEVTCSTGHLNERFCRELWKFLFWQIAGKLC